MRIITTATVAILALSTAALAQVAAPAEPRAENTIVTIDPNIAANAMMARESDNSIAMAGDLPDESALPAPIEPR